MKNIVLTSCGIRSEEFKNRFYEIVQKKDLENKKVLYITTAIDNEKSDKEWINEEYKTILDLGIKEENITEYKIGNEININDYDIMYVLGGNTIYLLHMIRKHNFDKVIKDFINSSKIYIGSSAGSQILGTSIKHTVIFNENNVGMTNFEALNIVDGLIVPHANKREEYINNLKQGSNEKIILLYDKEGTII